MPEGPSIVILREQAAGFIGRIVKEVAGNSRLDLTRMRGQRVCDLRNWGKHFLVCFDGFAMRVHFMLFGSYRINERKPATPRMSLGFARGELKRLQLRFLRMEEGPRAAQALAGPREDALPARRHAPVVPGEAGPPAAPRVLVRLLPAALRVTAVSRR